MNKKRIYGIISMSFLIIVFFAGIILSKQGKFILVREFLNADMEMPFLYFFIFVILILIIIKAFFINKTKSMRARYDLKKNEELLRTVINSSPDIICFKDGDGNLIEANVAMHKLFRVGLFGEKQNNNECFFGHTMKLEKNLIEFEESDENAWEMGTMLREERIFTNIIGKEKIYDVIKVPTFKEDGSRNGLIVLGRDITEKAKLWEMKKNVEESQKNLKELLEYERIRTEFFANLSHELRTPLNVILGALQLFELIQQNGDLVGKEDALMNYTNIMKQNCFRLIRIVNNLIDITKIDAGFFQIELKNYDIVSLVEEITLSVKDYVESKGIQLVFDTDIEEKVMAVDPDKIERILLNLLSNSIKFTNKNGLILVTVKDKEDGIIISVKDNGIGIPKDKQDAVFERFVQIDKSLSRNREGSGIGLSLVKSLVELHNGKIYIESEIDKGSEFIMEIPQVVLPNDEIAYDSEKFIENNIEKINIEFSDIYTYDIV